MKLVLDFLLISGLLFTATIVILLFKQKVKEPARGVLIIIFTWIFLVLLCYYAYLHRVRFLFYGTFIFSNSIDVFIGPLFLLYVQSITGSFKNDFKSLIPHFVFPILYLLVDSVPSLIVQLTDDFEIQYLDHLFPYVLFTIIYSFGYCFYALLKLLRFQKLVKEQYSNIENKNLDWIKRLLLGVLFIMAISITTSIYETIVGDQGWDIDFISVVPIVFLVAYTGYYGISQTSVLLPDFLKSNDVDTTLLVTRDFASNSKKYQYDDQEMERLKISLYQIMEKEKPFLEEDLTLTKLSTLLQVPDKKLSTLLNQYIGISFYDYVNGYRIEEVKKRLSLPESKKYTLLAIAYDCGFNSKSSFNRIFKKIVKLSPSDFRKTI